jgi:hypothetical protein
VGVQLPERALVYDNLHECGYPGSVKYEIEPCQNLITQNKIFCRPCFQLVTTEARKNWRLAFPYDVPYDIGLRDRREEILSFVQCITFAKRQLSLFGRKEKRSNV